MTDVITVSRADQCEQTNSIINRTTYRSEHLFPCVIVPIVLYRVHLHAISNILVNKMKTRPGLLEKNINAH